MAAVRNRPVLSVCDCFRVSVSVRAADSATSCIWNRSRVNWNENSTRVLIIATNIGRSFRYLFSAVQQQRNMWIVIIMINLNKIYIALFAELQNRWKASILSWHTPLRLCSAKSRHQSLQSGQFWAISIASFRRRFLDFRSTTTLYEDIPDKVYVRPYGCRTKSVSAGLSCGLGRTTALSVMHIATKAVRYIRLEALYKWTLPFHLFLFFLVFGMHCYECIAPNMDINLCRADDSEPFQLLHSGRGSWIFMSCWIVFNHIIWGRPSGLLQLSSWDGSC